MYFSGLYKSIRELEEKKFYDIAILFLSAKGYRALSIVDGAGDGGRDVICSWSHLRIQLSVQKNWEVKINKEAAATKAAGKQHFIYVTNRRIRDNEREKFIQGGYKHHGEVELTIFDLDSIATSLALPGVINATYEKLGVTTGQRLSATPSEVAISNTLLFSSEARDLRENLLESGIKAQLLESPGVSESQLVHAVANDLGGLSLGSQVTRALHRLQATGQVSAGSENLLLGEGARAEVEAAKRDFLQAKYIDRAKLQSSYELTEAQADNLIQLSLEILARKGNLGGDEAYAVRLAEAIAQAGLARKKQDLFNDLAALSCARVIQYGDAVNHVFATDTFDILRALGRSASVSAILDSSVAMPLLFGLSFGRARSRYGVGAAALSDMCRGHQIRLKVPRPYLNEMAYHGKKALEYLKIYSILGEEPRSVLRASGNAYISHFGHLRDSGKFDGKLTLEQFLAHFGVTEGAAVWSIEARIENLLASFDVDIMQTPRWSPEVRQRIASQKPGEAPIIIDHDASVGTLLTQTEDMGFIFATWDVALTKLVEQVSRVYADTPSRIVDFLSMARGAGYESEQTVSLLDSLIHCDERKAEALAKKIDKIQTAEAAYELQRFSDDARNSSNKNSSSLDIVEEFFSQHRSNVPSAAGG